MKKEVIVFVALFLSLLLISSTIVNAADEKPLVTRIIESIGNFFGSIFFPGTNPDLGRTAEPNDIEAVLATTITSCPYIISAPGEYAFSSSLSGSGTCVTVNSNNVIIDGQNYQINYDTPVDVQNRNNVTIKNIISTGSIGNNRASNITIEKSTLGTMIIPAGKDIKIIYSDITGLNAYDLDDWVTTSPHCTYQYPVERLNLTGNIIHNSNGLLIDIRSGGCNDAAFLPCPGGHDIENNTIISTDTSYVDGDKTFYFRCTTNSVVKNNRIYTKDALPLYLRDGASNNLFENNYMEATTSQRGALTSSSGSSGTGSYEYPSNNIFRNNTFNGTSTMAAGLLTLGSGNRFENNLFVGNGTGMNGAGEGGIAYIATPLEAASGVNTVYHNTFYNFAPYAALRITKINDPTSGKINLSNNIIARSKGPSGEVTWILTCETGASVPNYIGDNNIWYIEPSTPPYLSFGCSSGSSFANWKSAVTPNDAHSLESNPLFVNAATGNFHLQSSSPACNINGGYAGAYPCAASVGNSVNSCRALSSNNAYYLSQDISSAGTCFTISGLNNVTINGNGYKITAPTAFSITGHSTNIALTDLIVNSSFHGVIVGGGSQATSCSSANVDGLILLRSTFINGDFATTSNIQNSEAACNILLKDNDFQNSGPLGYNVQGYGFSIVGANSYISPNFTVINNKAVGLFLYGFDNLLIKDNNFSNPVILGFYDHGESNKKINNITFKNNTIISSNGTPDTRDVFRMLGLEFSVIDGNYIEDRYRDPDGYSPMAATKIYGNNFTTFANNKIVIPYNPLTNGHVVSGLYMRNSANDNYFYNNTWIILAGGSDGSCGYKLSSSNLCCDVNGEYPSLGSGISCSTPIAPYNYPCYLRRNVIDSDIIITLGNGIVMDLDQGAQSHTGGFYNTIKNSIIISNNTPISWGCDYTSTTINLYNNIFQSDSGFGIYTPSSTCTVNVFNNIFYRESGIINPITGSSIFTGDYNLFYPAYSSGQPHSISGQNPNFINPSGNVYDSNYNFLRNYHLQSSSPGCLVNNGYIGAYPCALVQMPSCTDTDSAVYPTRNYTVQGRAVSGLQSLTDYCIGNNLTEYYCQATSSTTVSSEIVNCAYGCSNGACNQSLPIITYPIITNIQVYGITTVSSIINWTTDVSSSSLVKYGTSSGVYTNSAIGINGISHSVQLTGLNPGTTYYYVVNSTNSNGRSNQSNQNAFITSIPPDITPPTITNISSSNITINSTLIKWDTNEQSSSIVKYGTSSGVYTSQSIGNSGTSHSVQLTGLNPGTTYYYVVNSSDSSGNSNQSSQQIFNTSIPPDITPPVIITISITSITVDSALITWTTDEQSSSLVKYGTSSGVYTSQSIGNSGTSHSVQLTGLNPGTIYYLVVNSTDAAGNSAQSSVQVFTTRNVDYPVQFGTGTPSNGAVIGAGADVLINATVNSTNSIKKLTLNFDNKNYVLPNLMSCSFSNSLVCDKGQIATSSGTTYDPTNVGQGVIVDSNDRLYYPSAGNMNNAEGTITFFVRPTIDWATNTNYVLFDSYNDATNTGIMILKPKSNNGQSAYNSIRYVLYTSPNGVSINTPNTIPFSTTKWTWISITYGNGIMKLYIDGTLINSNSYNGTITNLNNNLYIGQRRDGTYSSSASLSNFRIYSTALSDQEINNIFTRNNGPSNMGTYYARFQSMEEKIYSYNVLVTDSLNNNLNSETRKFIIDTQPPVKGTSNVNPLYNGYVHQYDLVTFTTQWTDNVQLAGYIFESNQFGDNNQWINSSYIPFSGTSNVSSYTFNVTAASNQNPNAIGWRFWAYDTAGKITSNGQSNGYNLVYIGCTSDCGGGGGGRMPIRELVAESPLTGNIWIIWIVRAAIVLMIILVIVNISIHKKKSKIKQTKKKKLKKRI